MSGLNSFGIPEATYHLVHSDSISIRLGIGRTSIDSLTARSLAASDPLRMIMQEIQIDGVSFDERL